MLTHLSKILLIASLLLVAGAAKSVVACSCGPAPSVLESFEAAGVVAILRVKSVERIAEGRRADNVRSSILEVVKVYKGAVKPGAQLNFAQGGGADCIWTFSEKMIGQEYLFYLRAPEKPEQTWIGFGCGRSRGIEAATDDLLYLNNLAKVRGKTRVSGTLNFAGAGEMPLGGIAIRLTNGKQTFRTKTDSHGVYEFYDVPAGKYLVEFDPVKGWKLDTFWLSYSRSVDDRVDPKVLPRIPIVVVDKKHASLDIHFDVDNAIRGKVVDPRGNPMYGVCLHAIDPDPEVKSAYNADCTAEDGSFTIEELPAGKYILVLNNDGKISATEPFNTFYYPNVTDRAKATVLFVAPGVFIDGVNITVPEVVETITVRGRFLYSDGNPVVDEAVEFKIDNGQTDPDDSRDDRDARGKTNEKGEFSFKILKGASGNLFGSMFTYNGEFKNCPALDKLIKASGKSATTVRTPAIALTADQDIFDLVLRYPFPRCEKDDSDDEEDED